jgi:hypothetical protein
VLNLLIVSLYLCHRVSVPLFLGISKLLERTYTLLTFTLRNFASPLLSLSDCALNLEGPGSARFLASYASEF